MRADQSDKCVAAVDGHRVVFVGAIDPIDQQGFDIGLEFGQHRVVRDDPGPCVEREK